MKTDPVVILQRKRRAIDTHLDRVYRARCAAERFIDRDAYMFSLCNYTILVDVDFARAWTTKRKQFGSVKALREFFQPFINATPHGSVEHLSLQFRLRQACKTLREVRGRWLTQARASGYLKYSRQQGAALAALIKNEKAIYAARATTRQGLRIQLDLLFARTENGAEFGWQEGELDRLRENLIDGAAALRSRRKLGSNVVPFRKAA